jgi:hypothetical protein
MFSLLFGHRVLGSEFRVQGRAQLGTRNSELETESANDCSRLLSVSLHKNHKKYFANNAAISLFRSTPMNASYIIFNLTTEFCIPNACVASTSSFTTATITG